MKMPLHTKAAAAVFLFTFGLAPADAKCALTKLSRFTLSSKTPLRAAAILPSVPKPNPTDPATDPGPQAADPTIVGLWNVQFVADGQVVDAGFDAWHADGTETLNDTTPPIAGDVCLGVWTKTGAKTYKLKHPSWIFDDSGLNLIGVVIIRETVTLDKAGNSYDGDLAVDAYDLAGNPMQHLEAKIQALRITPDDQPNEIGLPGFPTWPQMP